MSNKVWWVVTGAVFCSVSAWGQWTWTPETGRFVNLDNLPKETPELQIEHTRSLMVQGKYNDALDETVKFRNFYGNSEYADENQFLRGEILAAKGEYVKAAQEFQAVITLFPGTGFYDEVIEKEYELGDMLYERGVKRMAKVEDRDWYEPLAYFPPVRPKKPLRQAAEVYSTVIDNQPFTPEAAEAQYKVGRCQFAMENYVEASFEYKRVIEDYRGSEWLDEAAYDLAKCYEMGSYPPQYDQQPTRLAIAAIDDFTLTYPGDRRTEELLEVRDEMEEKIAEQRFLAVKFYESRNELNSARIYAEGILVEFPETEAAEKAAQWLEQHPTRQRLRAQFVGPGYIE